MILHSWDEIDKVRPLWAGREPQPNAEFEHFRLVCEIRHNVLGPCIILTDVKDAPALLVSRLERTSISPALGYLRPLSVNVKALNVVRGGQIGNLDERDGALILEEVDALLGRGEADVAVFRSVVKDSAFWRVLQARMQQSRLWHHSQWEPHHSMRLEKDPQYFWRRMGAKHRSWLRGRERRLMESQQEGAWVWHDRFPDLPALCERLEKVAARTYHRGLGVGFRHDREHLERFSLFARQGVLRVQTFETRDRIWAFWIGTVFGKTFFSGETA